MDNKQPVRNALGEKIAELLRGYRLEWTQDDDGNGYPLVDAVTPPGDGTITRGIEELENLAGEIAWLVIPAETPNALGEGRERGILREAPSGEAETSTVVLEGTDNRSCT